MVHSSGLHHISKRKRKHQELEKFPHPELRIRFLDRLLIVVAIIGPLSALPQLFKILFEKSVEGVSLLTWSLWLLLAIPWLIYGLVHKDKPIIVAHILWIIVEVLVIIGILIHG